MDLKKKFGITELKTGYKYIDSLEREYNTAEDFYKALHYIQYLNETKLTAAMFQERGLFEGWEVVPYHDYSVQVRFSNNSIRLRPLNILFFEDGKIQIIGVEIKQLIQTLADLARLTASNPIPLV